MSPHKPASLLPYQVETSIKNAKYAIKWCHKKYGNNWHHKYNANGMWVMAWISGDVVRFSFLNERALIWFSLNCL